MECAIMLCIRACHGWYPVQTVERWGTHCAILQSTKGHWTSGALRRPGSKVPPLERRMTKLLRHNTEGEYIRSDGFMLLSIVMILLGATEEQVREIVNSSKKNGASRFEIVTDLVHSTGEWIRARQTQQQVCEPLSRGRTH